MSELTNAFALWERKSNAGETYFTGVHEDVNLTGFINKNKTVLKAPDLVIYKGEVKKENEFCKLWAHVAESTNKKYMSGYADGRRVIAFFREAHTAKQPKLQVYYKGE